MGTDPKTGFRQVFPLHFNLAVFNEVRTKFPYNVSEVVASGKLCTWESWYGLLTWRTLVVGLVPSTVSIFLLLTTTSLNRSVSAGAENSFLTVGLLAPFDIGTRNRVTTRAGIG